eukprot:3205739-Rhodomonas_salina.1
MLSSRPLHTRFPPLPLHSLLSLTPSCSSLPSGVLPRDLTGHEPTGGGEGKRRGGREGEGGRGRGRGGYNAGANGSLPPQAPLRHLPRLARSAHSPAVPCSSSFLGLRFPLRALSTRVCAGG